MNILLINHYAGSPDMGMEFRPYYFAREWVKAGHRVDILAGSFSHLRFRNPSVSKDFERELVDGIGYRWVKTAAYKGNGLTRAWTMVQFVSKIRRAAGKLAGEIKPDVILCSSTYPMDTYAGQAVQKAAGGKPLLIHEAHDMWPSTLIELGGLSERNPFIRAVGRAERSAYRHADGVISMMPYTEAYMRKHGLTGLWTHIPLGYREEEWARPEALNPLHKKALGQIKKQSTFTVGYFGGHALSNHLEVLLSAAERLKTRPIHFVLVGKGVEKRALMERAAREGLDKVHFLPPVPKKEIPSLLAEFDCVYAGAKKAKIDEEFGICMNKIVDIMMGEKPAVCAISAKAIPVVLAGSGYAVPADDDLVVSRKILELAAMKAEDRQAMGKRGRLYAEQHFKMSDLAGQVLSFVEAVKEEKAAR